MSILKAILLTFLLIILFGLTQLVFAFTIYKTDLLPVYFQDHFLITIAISFIIAYSVMFYFFWKPKLNVRQSLRSRDYEFKFLPYLILIVFGYQLVGRPFWHIDKIWEFYRYSNLENDLGVFTEFSPAFYYQTFSMLILSPIFEELFFRKFLLKKLLQRNRKNIAIIISSICFALIHFETPYNLIPTFIFGVISSLIYINTQKIGYSILIHFLINLSLQILYVFDYPLERWLLSLHFNFTYWVVFLFGIILTYIGTKKILTTLYRNRASKS